MGSYGRCRKGILSQAYQQMFDDLIIRPERRPIVDWIISELMKNKARYEAVGGPLEIPWFVIGLIHQMECDGSFHKRLHDGGPLDGFPSWEAAACDALTKEEFHTWKDWSVPGILCKLEGYNGWGYRDRYKVNSAYLWSFSQYYEKGKYTANGQFDPEAGSNQAGAAVLLRRLVDMGLVTIPAAPMGPSPAAATGMPAKPITSTTYIVKSGDTLSAIAHRFGVDVQDLIDNNPQINDPDLIYPEDVIHIPGMTSPPAPPLSPAASTAPYATEAHTVQPGETLWSIAEDHDITFVELIRLNQGLITPGQELKVPQAPEPLEIPPAPQPGTLPTDLPSPALGTMPPWLPIALQELTAGVAETPDIEEHVQRIVDYHRSTNLTPGLASRDETAWCASFVNWCIKKARIPALNRAFSLDWLNWGERIKEPVLGSVVILWRSEKDKENNRNDRGHIGFYWNEEGNHILLLAGNQYDPKTDHDSVNIKRWPKELIRERGCRWPKGFPRP